MRFEMVPLEEHKKAKHEAWEEAEDIQDRIRRLEKVASKYPEYMVPYSDMATSYLEMGDVDRAVEKYQGIINLKEKFDFVWDNHLGIAYLFTGNIQKAIKTLEKSRVHSYDQGLFLALAYLKRGDKEKFEEKFDKWISECMEEYNELPYQFRYQRYIDALFGEEESRFIDEIWDKYLDYYRQMAL
ncbi:hypothetical protein AKJ64_02535 [candidate division MSBL1 archaeon SCGC-AAA259E17]|uniref:Uncharacterized protein n=1 Tax=candidate division MSBL1 archaeon SCGC-AAA259E17 TaxID=1698263 RepID=A0A133UEP0_9EURY|nr:hypothetical protein AKJ64_02535 [candidate division MSBL1 archaeon SCGC-AAA259E17]